MENYKLRRYVCDMFVPEDLPVDALPPNDTEVLSLYSKDMAYFNPEFGCFDIAPKSETLYPSDIIYANPTYGLVKGDDNGLYLAVNELPDGVCVIDDCENCNKCCNKSNSCTSSMMPVVDNKQNAVSNKLSDNDIINIVESLRDNINDYTHKVNIILDSLISAKL